MRFEGLVAPHRAWCVRAAVGALAAVLLFAPSKAGAVDVVVALGTAPTFGVNPGDEFDLDVRVTDAAAAFNGFDAVIAYDPSVLTFMPASPLSAQQGCLMTGGCSAACGTTYHVFAAAADSLAISDALLCNLISISGPGQIYRLHFKASNTAQTTFVRFRHAGFYDAGVRITPVTTTDVEIDIAPGVSVGTGSPRPGALSLTASPEPARGPLRFAISSDRPGSQVLEVHDVSGRRVRMLASGWQPAGMHAVSWDGRDDDGRLLPAGVYLATLRVGDAQTRTRVTLLR